MDHRFARPVPVGNSQKVLAAAESRLQAKNYVKRESGLRTVDNAHAAPVDTGDDGAILPANARDPRFKRLMVDGRVEYIRRTELEMLAHRIQGSLSAAA